MVMDGEMIPNCPVRDMPNHIDGWLRCFQHSKWDTRKHGEKENKIEEKRGREEEVKAKKAAKTTSSSKERKREGQKKERKRVGGGRWPPKGCGGPRMSTSPSLPSFELNKGDSSMFQSCFIFLRLNEVGNPVSIQRRAKREIQSSKGRRGPPTATADLPILSISLFSSLWFSLSLTPLIIRGLLWPSSSHHRPLCPLPLLLPSPFSLSSLLSLPSWFWPSMEWHGGVLNYAIGWSVQALLLA